MPIDSIPLNIGSLPPLLAGPIVRRLTGSSVSIWLACTASDAITLEVRRHDDSGPTSSVTVTPTQVGAHLWIATLTADAPLGEFAAGEIYEYDLRAPWESEIVWADLALPLADRPTFVAPPASVDDLVVFHSSCRKPHGGGRDALALALDELSERFVSAPPQPHLLLMSGDQIYADEVGHPIMPRVLRVAHDLIGIDETDVFGPIPLIGGRGPGTDALGYTGARANHLWSYGEFMAMYLLAWSPVLWPDPLPTFPAAVLPLDVDPAVSEESWNEERHNLQLFHEVLPRVRKVLANVASLMIFDDHEITDDWNLDMLWVNDVYERPGGNRAITNGLLAYVVCQHWGNKPAQFETAGTPERMVLDEIADAITASPRRSPAPVARPFLGVPAGGLPAAPPTQALRTLDQGAIRYDVTIEPEDGWPVRIVLLDERTVREFPRLEGRCARISRDALARQLPPPTNAVPLTILVAAAPVLGSDLVERMIQPLADLLMANGARGARFADYESWSAIPANHQDLLARIATHHPTVILSGDVHYGFTASLTRTEDGVTTSAAQLTGSAAKNTEIKNAAISMFGELAMRLGLERARDNAGFAALSASDQQSLLSAPPAGTSLAWDEVADVLLGRVAREATSAPTVMAASVASAYGLPPPDWTYTVTPVDDPMPTFNAPTVSEPWDGWDPEKSLVVADALQQADLERLGRMFVGLPQMAKVTFHADNAQMIVTHELRCAVGTVEPDPPESNRHVVQTEVILG